MCSKKSQSVYILYIINLSQEEGSPIPGYRKGRRSNIQSEYPVIRMTYAYLLLARNANTSLKQLPIYLRRRSLILLEE
jgi:hypothetical protein